MLIEVVIALEAHALEVVVQHEVDHACDGVGAVHRGGAARQQVDPFDEAGGELVEVGSRVAVLRGIAGHQAAPIDEHHGAIGAEAAQRHSRLTGGTVGEPRTVLTRHLRQAVQQVFDARDTTLLNGFLSDTRQRARGFDLHLRDAGSGHDDGLDLGSRFGLHLRQRGKARGGGRGTQHEGAAHGATDLSGAGHGVPPDMRNCSSVAGGELPGA